MSIKTINICIPVYNEEENLEVFYDDLKNITSSIEQKYKINLKIVFFDDGSTDNSRDKIKMFDDADLIFSDENKGLGFAIKELITYTKKSNADGMFKIDGDGQMNVIDLEKFIEKDLYKNSDVIYGNRFHTDSKYKMPLLRRLGSSFFKYFMKIFSVKISDPTNGFVYLSKRYIDNFKIIGNYNAAQQILLDAKLRKLKISEVDIELKTRASGESFVGIKYPIIVISNLIALYVYKKTVRILIAPGIISLLIGFILLIYNIYLWASGIKTQIISDQILVLFIVFGAQLSITGFVIEIIKNRSN
tara:strand:- start:2331 stop:3239 length:909 start_codon:yes stop_codon:yes gene_type:complete